MNKLEDYINIILNSNGFKRICNTNEEVFNFIHNVKHKEHCILVFQTDDFRDEIVNEFFNPEFARNTATASFTHELSKYNCDHKITYNDLSQKQILLPTKISDFLVNVLNESYKRDSIRIACEDTAWFSEAGFFEEHQKCGNELDDRVINESIMLCCYNSNKLDEKKMNVVLSSRKYVILEEPFSVYQKDT